VNNTVRPVRSDALVVSTAEWVEYTTRLEQWCDNIEQLHANQGANIAGYQKDVQNLRIQADNVTEGLIEANRTIAELRAMNETQMTRINEVVERSANKEVTIGALQAEVEQHKLDVLAWQADLAIIREELQSEAEHRDWCSEYRDFTDRVNARLTVALIGPELHTFNVVHTYTVEVTGSVQAKDRDDANRLARAQYNGIIESAIFSLPDDSEDALDPDRGELFNVSWSHDRSEALENS